MSADVFRFKRGATAQCNAYLPALGEPVYDTTLKTLKIGDGVAFGGNPITNVASAAKWTTPRTITVSGTVTGSISLDGSADATLTTAVGASLQTSLDAKAPLASPALTGVPTAPTASVGTATAQVATTAFVTGQASATNPLINGTAAAGTSLGYSRGDHVHPTDTSRAPLASPSLTGTPLSTTPAVGTNTTQIATAAMVQAEIANKRAWTTYTPTVTASSGTFTTVTATGKYMVAFGVCHVQIRVTVTTKGTGVQADVTLPLPALSGSVDNTLIARESAVNGKLGVGVILASLTTVRCKDYINADLITADGCIIVITGSYPVA